MHAIHHRYADIDGQQLFYREAGAANHRIDIRGPADTWLSGGKNG